LQYLTKPIDVKEFLRAVDLFLTGQVTKSTPPVSVP
jgi:DNA-binding response OmpR family regulator